MKKKSRFALTMNLICVFTAVLSALLFVLYDQTGIDALESVAITVFTVFYHFAMRLAVGGAVPFFTRKIDPLAKFFAAGKRERTFLNRLGLKRHKDKIPTYRPELFDPKLHTMEEIAIEMCRAEVVHMAIIPLSFVPIAFIPFWGAPAVFIITSVLAAMADSVFVALQRYNLSRIQPLLARKKRQKL